MVVYFFDSSALAKRYVAERGSAWVNSVVRAAARKQIHLARITGVEIVSAIVRRGRSGTLPPATVTASLTQFRFEFAHHYRMVAVTPRLLTRAMTLAEKHALRGYDAVQLAAALQLNVRLARRKSSLILVSADAELTTAATAEGLTADDPNVHP